MSKKTNKTSVAEALKVIADALTSEDKAETTSKVKKPKSFLAIYVEQRYAPSDARTGQYIYDEDAQEAYYQMYPSYRPKKWALETNNQAPRYMVEIENGDEKAALTKIEKGLEGLKLINNAATQQYKDKFHYHVVKIEETTVN
jgi:hypothetical protein